LRKRKGVGRGQTSQTRPIKKKKNRELQKKERSISVKVQQDEKAAIVKTKRRQGSGKVFTIRKQNQCKENAQGTIKGWRKEEKC